MEKVIKTRILELYENGFGYKKIVSYLNVSIGSVRNVLKEKEDNHCKFCGNKLIFIPDKKRKIFCNDYCRYKY